MHQIDISTLGKYIKKFLKGGSLKVHPHESEHMLRLVFKTKKPFTRLLKNLNAGKATHIKHSDLDDVISHETGGSLWGSIKNVVTNPSNIKAVAKIVAPEASKIISNKVGQITGSQTLANLTDKGINAGVDAIPSGSGLFGDLGNAIGSLIDNKTGTGLKRRGRPKKMSHDGSGLFGDLGNAIGSLIDNKTGTGLKRRGRPKKVGGSFAPLGGGSLPSGVHNNVVMLRHGNGINHNKQQYQGITGTPSWSIPHM